KSSRRSSLNGCALQKRKKRFRHSSRSVRLISTSRRHQSQPNRSVTPAMSSKPMPAHEYMVEATAQSGALWRIASTRMPTKWGMFNAIGFERDIWNGGRKIETALALVMGDLNDGVPLLRIHSQCLTGEVLGSLRCDCRDQLEMAMQAIA